VGRLGVAIHRSLYRPRHQRHFWNQRNWRRRWRHVRNFWDERSGRYLRYIRNRRDLWNKWDIWRKWDQRKLRDVGPDRV
jgi:hypothetical protein